MEMTVAEVSGSRTLVILSGRLDAAGADQIALRFTAAAAATGRDALVDMSAVGFVASMGMRMLVSAARALDQKGAHLVLFGASELVHGAWTDAGLDQLIPSVPNLDAALAFLSRHP